MIHAKRRGADVTAEKRSPGSEGLRGSEAAGNPNAQGAGGGHQEGALE